MVEKRRYLAIDRNEIKPESLVYPHLFTKVWDMLMQERLTATLVVLVVVVISK